MCCKVIKKFFQRWTFWLTCVDCIHIPSSADDCRWTGGGVVCSRSLALLLLLLVVNGVALLLLWCCSINGTTTTTTCRWWTRFRSWGFAGYISKFYSDRKSQSFTRKESMLLELFFSNLAIPNWYWIIFLHFRALVFLGNVLVVLQNDKKTWSKQSIFLEERKLDKIEFTKEGKKGKTHKCKQK